ncbi:unnamed protein product [Paramecium pentaurelia]|uniref:Uncharacterized protein n=1 Tax=Paramecium pentaurelia TaxID=43138 RepID=A0A8S1VJ26_9CILI|nr:unnamed protein product [Paramecium pentaurelia]
MNYIENIDHLQVPSLNIKIKTSKPLAPNAAKYSEFM